MTADALDGLPLLRLARWLSPAYPTGAFAWSHGLEAAVAAGEVRCAATLADWLDASLRHGAGRTDAILIGCAHRADARDLHAVAALADALAPSRERRAEALALGVPVVWAGATGSIVSVVRDAPNLVEPSATSTAVPPEFAGFTSSLRFLVPLVVSSIAGLTALAMRESPTAGTGMRMSVLDALVIAGAATWVLKRDDWTKAWRGFLDAGRKAGT